MEGGMRFRMRITIDFNGREGKNKLEMEISIYFGVALFLFLLGALVLLGKNLVLLYSTRIISPYVSILMGRFHSSLGYKLAPNHLYNCSKSRMM